MYSSEILVLFVCLKKRFVLNYVYGYVLMNVDATEALCPLELALQGVVSHPTWVLDRN